MINYLMKSFYLSGLVILTFLLSLSACKTIIPEDQTLTKENVLSLMKEWYLWNDTIPDIDLSDYNSPSAVLEACKLKDIDRWSAIVGSDKVGYLYSNSSLLSSGIGWTWNNQDELMVGFVYPESDPDLQGVSRGWKILRINGQTVTRNNLENILYDSLDAENSFTFQTGEGGSQELFFTNKILTPGCIFYSDTFTYASRKVGYLVIDNFFSQGKDEIQTRFQELLGDGINELIIDIRYNNHGVVEISGYLANIIAGNQADKGPFVRYLFNELKVKRNIVLRFATEAESLTLDRVFFITGENTSGAAEVLINGLIPYIDVFLVGKTTAGRPVGVISQNFPDSTLLPVTYRMANRNNQGDYFNGLTPDSMIPDDFSHSLGDKEEACLREILYYIQNGSFSTE
jgi:C-terminal processing protease CtpA/Prc